MWKKLIAAAIALIIITGLSMTVFAGYDEGGGLSAPTSAAAAAKSSAASKDTQASQTSQTGKDKSRKSTYDDLEVTGPDAEFFAAIKKVLVEGKPSDNKVTVIEIKKPEKYDEKVSIYSRKFDISVKTEFDDVIFSVARLNNETGEYERIEFDGEKSIKLACGVVSKEVILEYGTNNLLLISYRDSEKDPSKVQYNIIVVEANKETTDDKAVAPEKPVKKPGSDPLSLFETIIDNLLGKGK